MVELNKVPGAILTIVAIGVLIIISIFLFGVLGSNLDPFTNSTQDTLLANVNSPQTLNETPSSGFFATVKNQTWLEFDGVNDIIDVNSSVAGIRSDSGFTVGVFLRHTNQSGRRDRLANLNNIYAIYKDANLSSWSIYGGNGTDLDSTASIITSDFGNWTLLVTDFNLTKIFHYKNGKYQVANDFVSTYVEFDSEKNFFGRGASDVSPDYYSDDIGEIFVYNRSIYNSNIQEEFYNRSVFGGNLGKGIPILLFHVINDGSETYDISTNIFDSFMFYLNSSGFTTITSVDYYNWKNNNYVMPKKPILLTFDDSSKSIYTNASVIMDKYGFVATSFIVTNIIGGSNMNWSDISSLIEKGWAIGSHTFNHTSLNSSVLSDDVIIFLLNESYNQIYNNLSYSSISFACPNSIHDNNVDLLIADFYSISFCDYWSGTFSDIKYAHKSFDLVGTQLYRGDITNATTLAQFIKSSDIDADLLFYYNLNENSGTIAYDVLGNANNGTISGATWNNDGINNTLTEDIDYNRTDTTFTTINSEFAWSEVLANYNFFSETEARNAISSMSAQFSLYPILIGLLGTIIFIGLVIFVLAKSFIKEAKV